MRWIIALSLSLYFVSSFAQDKDFPSSKMAVVVTVSDHHVIGKLIEDNAKQVVLLVNGKERKVFEKSVVSFFKILDQNDLVIGGQYMFPTASQTGYLLTTSAFTLKDAKFSANGAYLTHTDLQLRITENLDAGVGTILGAPLSFSLKARYQLGSSLNIGIKTYSMWGSYFDPNFSINAGQGLITTGTPERNVTIGPGVGVVVLDRHRAVGVVFSTFGLKSRLNQRLTLVAEGIAGRPFQSGNVIDLFSGQAGLQFHVGRTITWSGGLGVAGFREAAFNYWGRSLGIDTTLFPQFYVGFRKIWR